MFVLLLNEDKRITTAAGLFIIPQFGFLNLTRSFDIDNKRSSFPKLTLDGNLATHLLDDLFANAESKPSPTIVPCTILFKLAEVDEQVLLAFWTYPNARVNDADLKINVQIVSILKVIVLLIRLLSKASQDILETLERINVVDVKPHVPQIKFVWRLETSKHSVVGDSIPHFFVVWLYLIIQCFDSYSHWAPFVCELQRVRQKVKQDLKVPPLVTMDLLYHV